MQDLFSFSEEKTRAQWWTIFAINFVVGLIVYGFYTFTTATGTPNPILSFIVLAVGLVLTVIQIAADVNRLRDGGFSPYLIFLGFVPLVGGLIIFVLCGFMPSR